MPEKRTEPRKLIWLVDSLDRLSRFPPGVRKKVGFALYQAQIGQQHESAKMLRGFAEAVWQVRADDPSGTYQTVSLTQVGEAIYVLTCFSEEGDVRNRNSQERTGVDPAAVSACAQVGEEVR